MILVLVCLCTHIRRSGVGKQWMFVPKGVMPFYFQRVYFGRNGQNIKFWTSYRFRSTCGHPCVLPTALTHEYNKNVILVVHILYWFIYFIYLCHRSILNMCVCACAVWTYVCACYTYDSLSHRSRPHIHQPGCTSIRFWCTSCWCRKIQPECSLCRHHRQLYTHTKVNQKTAPRKGSHAINVMTRCQTPPMISQ